MDQPQGPRTIEQVIQDGYTVDVPSVFTRGLDLFKQALAPFVVWTLLGMLASALCGTLFKTFGGIAAGALVSPFMAAGILVGARRLMRGESVAFGDLMKVFDNFANLALAGLLAMVIVCLGFVLCLLPGIYAKIALTFLYPFIVFRGIDPIEAIKKSVAVVNRSFVSVLLFGLLAFFILVVGALLCGVGLLFAYPIVVCSIAVLYSDVFGMEGADRTADPVLPPQSVQ